MRGAPRGVESVEVGQLFARQGFELGDVAEDDGCEGAAAVAVDAAGGFAAEAEINQQLMLSAGDIFDRINMSNKIG